MKKRKIGFVVDSTFKINPALKESEQVGIIPLKVIIDGKEYIDGEFDYQEVVKGLQNKKSISTSQPSPDAFEAAYKKQLELGYDHVICLTISKTLSGTINSANLGVSIGNLQDKVTVIDSMTTITGGEYVLEKVLEYANSGASKEEVIEKISALIQAGSLLFTVDNLNTLVRNGRLSKTSALIGNILRIKPILRFDQGVLSVEHKARSFSNVVKYIYSQTKLLLEKTSVIVRVVFVDIDDKATQLVEELKTLGERLSVEIKGVISPVVAAHVGLGGLGVYIARELS